MRIFLSAGEASGDAYGAALVREIKGGGVHPNRPDLQDAVLALMRKELAQLSEFNWEADFSDTWDVDDLEGVEFLYSLRDEFGIAVAEQDVISWKTNLNVLDLVCNRLFKSESVSDLCFEGIGGPRLRTEGVKLYADSSHWGAISIAQAAKVFFRILWTMHGLKHNLRRGIPGLLIVIDFGFANIRLAKYARKHGWKVLYFVPPGSWRRDRQGTDIPIISDEIVTPFEWSAEILNRMGGKAHWFGHPIKQLIREEASLREERVGGGTIAVLPGSRKHELEMNLPLIAKAVGEKAVQGGLTETLEFALAPGINLEKFKEEWNRLAPGRQDLYTVGDTYVVLRRARMGIICSGTATLEAALCGCPMVVVYQLSKAMIREAKLIRMKRPKFISLPNIIMDREIVPELADERQVEPADLRAWIDRLLIEEDVRCRQLEDFRELDRLLGADHAITKTAELAIKMIS
ncbi:MAG: hypothetical protein H7Y17_02535 [Chlorobia bacterium]|nr:hypothetical protein [Fimbriimonadaceae bacterium]